MDEADNSKKILGEKYFEKINTNKDENKGEILKIEAEPIHFVKIYAGYKKWGYSNIQIAELITQGNKLKIDFDNFEMTPKNLAAIKYLDKIGVLYKGDTQIILLKTEPKHYGNIFGMNNNETCKKIRSKDEGAIGEIKDGIGKSFNLTSEKKYKLTFGCYNNLDQKNNKIINLLNKMNIFHKNPQIDEELNDKITDSAIKLLMKNKDIIHNKLNKIKNNMSLEY